MYIRTSTYIHTYVHIRFETCQWFPIITTICQLIYFGGNVNHPIEKSSAFAARSFVVTSSRQLLFATFFVFLLLLCIFILYSHTTGCVGYCFRLVKKKKNCLKFVYKYAYMTVSRTVIIIISHTHTHCVTRHNSSTINRKYFQELTSHHVFFFLCCSVLLIIVTNTRYTHTRSTDVRYMQIKSTENLVHYQ